MAQEIISYSIIAFAAGLAIYKSYKKLRRGKRIKSADKTTISAVKKKACSDCLAECVLRDAPENFRDENTSLCERDLKKIKCS